ncbi:site-specific DNA-methyltransferase [Shouchella clausii]|uniref:site-specific DNA-methyltransferase n=1 Tax=Shouchella clausii TaxID=79880 RepID=UPI000B96E19C|nr:site-specific DNA-methyltransferase [Shouchella clausii]AST95667.1 site-specific DNA-methyltransferase [Shouchella clausii]MCR1288066.1 site-specific DNA-methyltransferase [Shouchella clausii]MEB5472067.1 site-specific DNA-methyltransferase [Shouchella clausii]QNM42021.1 site-specific DNA-methyltransferase [Shouchella clausii]WQG95151.1 site-specific DNA-methyltransferase [Shouchella clausii]
MSIEELKRPVRIDEDRIEKLKELFPEAFGDGRLNIELLKELIKLSDDFSDADSGEFFGLQWAGKKEARRLSSIPATGTLNKSVGEGINEDNTDNIIIEGDNLEVLRILQKSYSGRIQTIYIDPPYNTDKDYIYKDTFKEPVESYLQKSNQADEEGLLTSNPKASGRYHANWLNMMYPRLKLAWSLLKPDGILCVSISDIEEANLRKILDEIFGEENHINTVSVKSKVSAGASGGGEDKRLKKNLEYIHMYAKNLNELQPLSHLNQRMELKKLISEMREEGRSWKYTSVFTDMGERKKIATTMDGDGNPIEIFLRENVKRTTVAKIMKEEGLDEEQVYKKYLNNIFRDTNAQSSIRQRVIDAVPGLSNNQVYEIEYTPRSGKNKGNRIVQTYVGNTIQLVVWLKDVVEEVDGTLMKLEKLGTLWDDIDYNNVGREGGIPYPNGKKPIELIKRCIQINDTGDGIVMDFFAGSGSTGHAVLDMNAEDNGLRKFILVQLPEIPKDSEFDRITELTKQRLRNSIAQLNEKDGNAEKLDRGFSVYNLDKTNIKKWEEYEGDDITVLNEGLDLFTSHPLNEQTSEINIITELMLNQGFPLDSRIKTNKVDNELWIVEHEDVSFSLVVCLDEKLDEKSGDYLATNYEKSTFICLDDALTNKQKILLSEAMNVKTI